MNGRVYDPLTAMFFSPDPFVSSPDDWLNYNRYGYCMNNPTRYTDPSGYHLVEQLMQPVEDPRPMFPFEGYSGGGGSMFASSMAWNAQGSISWNYENQRIC